MYPKEHTIRVKPGTPIDAPPCGSCGHRTEGRVLRYLTSHGTDPLIEFDPPPADCDCKCHLPWRAMHSTPAVKVA